MKKFKHLFVGLFVVASLMSLSSSRTKKHEINLDVFNNIDLIESVAKANDIDFVKTADNAYEIVRQGIKSEYELSNGRLSSLDISRVGNSSGYNARLEETAIHNEYEYEQDSLIKALTNGQTLEVVKDGNTENFLLNGETLLNKTTDDLRQIVNYANGGKRYVVQNGEDVREVIYDDKDKYAIYTSDDEVTKIVDHAGNEKTFAYENEIDGYAKVNENNFSYEVSGNNIITSLADKQTTTKYANESGVETRITNDIVYQRRINNDEFVSHKSLNGLDVIYNYLQRNNELESIKLDSLVIGDYYEIDYGYDYNNNINAEIYDDGRYNKYEYDQFGQLIYFENKNHSSSYVYDARGNIVKKDGIDYRYEGDRLLSWGNSAVEHDNLGNIIKLGDTAYSYQRGTVLSSIKNDNLNVSYSYDVFGIRNKKIVNNIETRYYTVDNKIIYEISGEDVVEYLYDDTDSLYGFIYDNNLYFYVRDAKEEIIAISDAKANIVVSYQYDPWGKIIGVQDYSSAKISQKNHFVYKGYYFDAETNLYYLESRYYSPEIGRFISIDNLERIQGLGTQDINLNLYAYADNNPVMKVDYNGYFAITFAAVASILAILQVALGCIIITLAILILVGLVMSAVITVVNDYGDEVKKWFDSIRKAFETFLRNLLEAIIKSNADWAIAVLTFSKAKYKGQTEVHHIIAKNDPRHGEARSWLNEYSPTQKTEDPRNKVTIKKLLHKHIHTNQYYSETTEMLREYSYKIEYKNTPEHAIRESGFFSTLLFIKGTIEGINAKVPG